MTQTRRRTPGVIKTPGGRWKAIWRDPEGRQRSRTFARFEDARALRSKMIVDRSRGAYRDPRSGDQRLGEYLERLLSSEQGLRPATQVLYEGQAARYVLPRFGSFRLASIQPGDVREWIAALVAAGVGARTVQVAFQVLSRTLRQAVVDGLIPANPAQYVRRPESKRGKPRILDPDEVEALAGAIDPRYRVLVLTAAYGGLRFSEATALRRERVRILERKLEIVEGLTEVRGQVSFGPLKTEASRRTVAIPAFLTEEMAVHMARYMRPPVEDPQGSDLLLTAPEGGPIRRSSWRHRFWIPAVGAAGLDPAPRFHDLRHTAASLAIQAGAHPRSIQARLGHSSITTTLNVYGGLFPGLDEEIAQRLEEAHQTQAAERRT